MQTPFPGMDPYLEQPGLWEEVHLGLISSIQRFLTPILRPTYRVAVEQRTYLDILPPDEQFVGKPDILAITDRPAWSGATVTAPVMVEPQMALLPQVEEVTERYLEIRRLETQEVVTVIEILSPSNKRAGEGRQQYLAKRLKVLQSLTNLIEIDLLRAGKPLPMTIQAQNHYRLIVSRGHQRPRADGYLFSVRQPMPDIPVPLRPGEPEPALKLNHLLHELYDHSGYDLAINYHSDPPPPAFTAEETAWLTEIIS